MPSATDRPDAGLVAKFRTKQSSFRMGRGSFSKYADCSGNLLCFSIVIFQMEEQFRDFICIIFHIRSPSFIFEKCYSVRRHIVQRHKAANNRLWI